MATSHCKIYAYSFSWHRGDSCSSTNKGTNYVALNVALNVATHLGALSRSLALSRALSRSLSRALSRALLPPLRPRATPAATPSHSPALLSRATQSRHSRLLSPTLATYSRSSARLATSAAPPTLRSSGLLSPTLGYSGAYALALRATRGRSRARYALQEVPRALSTHDVGTLSLALRTARGPSLALQPRTSRHMEPQQH